MGLRTPHTARLRVPGQRQSSQGQSGPKPRLVASGSSVGDGEQVDSPAPAPGSEAGTRVGGGSRSNGQGRSARGRGGLGKSGPHPRHGGGRRAAEEAAEVFLERAQK